MCLVLLKRPLSLWTKVHFYTLDVSKLNLYNGYSDQKRFSYIEELKNMKMLTEKQEYNSAGIIIKRL